MERKHFKCYACHKHNNFYIEITLKIVVLLIILLLKEIEIIIADLIIIYKQISLKILFQIDKF